MYCGHSLASGQEPVTEKRIAPGGRNPIQLTLAEREFVLNEMRIFLESTKNIVNGIASVDMDLVAKSARISGRAAQSGMPTSLPEKLPITFKQLGSDTHRKFDELALDAEQLGDGEHSLSQLGHLLGNCVSCHSAYRIEVKQKRDSRGASPGVRVIHNEHLAEEWLAETSCASIRMTGIAAKQGCLSRQGTVYFVGYFGFSRKKPE